MRRSLRHIAVLVCVPLILAAGPWGCRARDGARGSMKEVRFTADDGVMVVARYYPAKGDAPRPRGLVLVHRPGGDGAAWEMLARKAQAQGYAVVAPDLRGHGATIAANPGMIPHDAMETPAWADVFADLRGALRFLREQGADPRNLAVIGEGGGANLALAFAVAEPGVQAVVVLSPEQKAKGRAARPLVEALGDCPVLIMASEGDTHGAAIATGLHTAARGFCELRTFTGSAYGADLLAAAPEAAVQLFHWLDTVLAEETP